MKTTIHISEATILNFIIMLCNKHVESYLQEHDSKVMALGKWMKSALVAILDLP